MIEITVDEIEGTRFLKDFKLVEPLEKRHGVVVERVSCRELQDENFNLALKLMGFRRGELIYWYDAYEYVQYPIPYYWYRAVNLFLKCYWKVLKFLYDNARLFKQIPEGECFSWRSFTPYVWFKKLKKSLQNRI